MSEVGQFLEWRGKHSKGKACLYLNSLADADQAVLAELIAAGLEDLRTKWPVLPI